VAGDPRGCPAPAEVAAELRRIAGIGPPPATGAAAAEVLTITEEPGGFRVELRGRTRRFDDAPRDCARRTHVAAVVAALLLEADEAAAEPAAAAVPAPAPPAGRSRPGRAPPRIELSLAQRLTLGLRPDGPGVLDEGAALRLAIGARPVRASIGLALAGPATIASPLLRVQVLRVPVDASARLVVLSGRDFELALELGLWTGPLRLANLATPEPAVVRWDVGARAAAVGRVRLWGRLHAFTLIEEALSFAPVALRAAESGVVSAHTPRHFIAVQLGLAVALDDR